MRRYTLWTGYVDEGKEAILLEDEPLFLTKRNAFKRAKELAKDLAIGWDKAILVRLVVLGSALCKEWVFPSN